MNNHVPYIWRKNYRNSGPWPEQVLQTAHEKAQQYLTAPLHHQLVIGEGMLARFD